VKDIATYLRHGPRLRSLWLVATLALGGGFATGTRAAEDPKSIANNTLFEAEFSLAVGGFFP